ncbi:MAG: hypothetical protein MUO64_01340 [Anaerolineales bacterium]|nr:hypothetical protein [Anaerolineales bacterium]
MSNKILRLSSPGATEPLYSHTHAPLFDCCGNNDLMSLTVAGTNPFLDWLGWQSTSVYRLVREYILFNRAKATGAGSGVATSGWLCDPCADPNGIETEYCELEIEDFGRLRRKGPVRDRTKTALNYCENSPRYRIDGTQIADDFEYDMVRATEVIIQDLAGLIVPGSFETCGQFDGLEHIVKRGYDCCTLDSIVIDWNSSPMDESDGAEWNDTPIPDDTSFVSLLGAIVRRIRSRIRMVPSLGGRSLQTGDMVLVMPDSFIACLLDAYTCWSVCPTGFIGNIWVNAEDRAFRQSLEGGMFGAGQITIEGVTIPIVPFDYHLISTGNEFDAYLLTRGIGNRRWLYGQYNDMSQAAAAPADSAGEFQATDGGRLLTWGVGDHTCSERIVEMQPRLVCEAPWAQARIHAVVCDPIGGPLSTEPWSEYFPYGCEEEQGDI